MYHLKSYFLSVLFSGLFSLSSFSQKGGASYSLLEMKSSPFEVAPSYFTKHDIVYRSPTVLEAEGFPMGNGNMGGMIWNYDNGIEIQINKNDLWTKPILKEENSSILKHAARLKIDFGAPVFSWIHMKDFKGRLCMQNGEVSYTANTAYTSTAIRTWLAHGKNVWVLECENNSNTQFMQSNMVTTVTMERVGSRAFARWYSGGFPKDATVGIGDTKMETRGKDLVLKESGDGLNFVVACRITNAGSDPTLISSHRGELKTNGKKMTVLLSVVTDKESDDPEKAAIALLDDAEKETIAKLREEKDQWYRRFWSNSFVKLGNDYLENIYYLRRYLMAAGSQGQYPVAFNGGLWRWNRDVLNWITPHHWNTQQQYWGLGAQNDCQLMLPYLSTYFKMMPSAESLAKEKGAAHDALLITEAHDFDGRQVSKDWDNMDKDYTPASQVASLFWDYYEFNGNRKYLRDTAYPFMKKAANFYLDKLQWDATKNEYYLLASLYESESIDEVKNPISDRNCIESLLKNCIKAATQLKMDADKIKQWNHILAHLWERKFEDYKQSGEMISPAEAYFTKEKYTPLSWASGGSIVFPSGLIGIDEKGGRLGAAVANLVKCNDRANAHYPTPIIAARLGMGDQALTYLLNGIKVHQMYPQGLMTNVTGYPDNIYNLQSIHDLIGGYKIRSQSFFQCGMEPISDYGTAVNEMMLQSNEDKIRVFPAIPHDWDSTDLAFTLLARGAFIVSSQREKKGVVSQVGIKSLNGNPCRLQNPWQGQKISIYQVSGMKKVKVKIDEDDIVSFETKAGIEYIVCLSNAEPVLQKNTYAATPNESPKKIGARILGKESGWNE